MHGITKHERIFVQLLFGSTPPEYQVNARLLGITSIYRLTLPRLLGINGLSW